MKQKCLPFNGIPVKSLCLSSGLLCFLEQASLKWNPRILKRSLENSKRGEEIKFNIAVQKKKLYGKLEVELL